MADNEQHKSGNLKWAAGDPITATKMERIEEAIDTLHSVRNDINNKRFPAKKQFLCRYCTYKNLCDEY